MENTQPITSSQPMQESPVTSSTPDYASYGSRVGAAFADAVVIGLPTVIVLKIVGAILFVPVSLLIGNKYLFTFLFNLFDFLVLCTVIAYFVSKTGQTPGKKWMKIKIINKVTSLPPTFKEAFKRNALGGFLDLPLFGMLWPLFDAQKQTLHDKVANTIVVKA